MKAVLDTRFLIAHFFTPDATIKKWTGATLRNLQTAEQVGVVPSIVVLEFYRFMLQNYGKDIAEMRTNLILSSNLQVANLDSSIAIEAAKLRCRYAEIPTADAIIAATAIAASSDCILTDDKHIKQVKETKTRWI
jgi:predicted nucleic acid-binding protein